MKRPPLLGERVEMGRVDLCCSITAKITISHVVAVDQNHVRTLRGIEPPVLPESISGNKRRPQKEGQENGAVRAGDESPQFGEGMLFGADKSRILYRAELSRVIRSSRIGVLLSFILCSHTS